jgi:hypothetical protein
MAATESLYDDDFFAWTQQQAELLRRLAPPGNELDLEHIAEEIEDLGRSDLRAARSLCQHIIEHLLKLDIPVSRTQQSIGATKLLNGAFRWPAASWQRSTCQVATEPPSGWSDASNATCPG